MISTQGKKRTVPIRLSMFVALASLVMLVTGSTLAVSLIKTHYLISDMVKPLIGSAQRQTEMELHRLFDPITEQALYAHGWVTSGLVKRYEEQSLMDLFLPGMSRLTQCVSMMISDMTGYEYTIFRNDSESELEGPEQSITWLTRDFRRENPPAHWQKPARWSLWDGDGRRKLRVWWEDPSWTVEDVLGFSPSGTSPDDIQPEDLLYDPRKRSWHAGPIQKYREVMAVETHKSLESAIFWTDIDYFFTSKAPGITAAIAARDPQGEMVIVAYDLLLRDLSDFTMAIRPTEHGKVFVFTRSGQVVGLPDDESLRDDDSKSTAILKHVEDTGVQELVDFKEHWREHESNYSLPFSFLSGGNTWWAGISPFSISPEHKLWLAVIIPEADLMGAASRERLNIIGIALAALALSMILAWYLSRVFSSPLRELTAQSKRIADLDLAPGHPAESRHTEILELSDSLEVMRGALEKYISETRLKEEELSRAAQQWQATFDAANDVIWILDAEHRLLRSNKAAKTLVNRPLTELIGGRCFEILHDTAQPVSECPLLRAKKSLHREKMELQIGEGCFEVTVDPILDEAGVLIGAVHIVSDITDRKRAEEELSQIFRMSLDMICIADINTATFLKVNPAFTEILGHSEGELLGRPFLDFVHPEDVDRTLAVIEDSLRRGEKVINFVNRYLTKAGNYRWLNWVSHPVPEHGITYAVAHDITEQKESEHILRESEERLRISEKRFRDLFASISDVIFTQDLDGRFLSVNPSVCRLFGYDEKELVGRRVSDFMKPEFVQALESEYLEKIKKDGYHEGTSVYFTREGRKIYLEYRSSMVYPEEGAPYITGTGRDVTAKILSEREVKKLHAQLTQAQKMEAIGTLAGGIAHNFNNVLMGIQGRASLMMMGKDPSSPDYEHLKGIKEYVKSATELTRDLLGFARGGKYQVMPVDLNALIKHESRIFGLTKKEISVIEKYEKALWTVEVDQGQMRQVFLNLYVNAWQAMPGGGSLYVQTENVTLGEEYAKPFAITPGRYVKVSVTDTGIGMDDSVRERIFDPFFSTKDKGQGSGLGLASVYGIIKNHGGFINVYSEKGIGTTFNIYLPASEKEAVEQRPIPDREDIHYGKGTVLLVDDEDMILDVGRMMLEKLGYRVLVARSGREALDVYSRHKEEIDLVILDMVMPGLNGGEAYDRLKAMDQDVKIILSSGYSINGLAKEIVDRGCEGFIQKPFAMEELSRKVKEVFDR